MGEPMPATGSAPAETRPRLIKALRMLATKREAVPARKHGNIPL